MKLNNVFLILFGILPIWPQYKTTAQGTKETIRQIKEVMHTDSTNAVADSLINVNDSIAGSNFKIVNNLEKVANTLPEKTDRLKRSVAQLANQPPDTVRMVKYIPLPEPVNKEEYWKRQREYSDSIAQAKKDSIAWKHRGLLKKIFGPKKQKR